MKLKCFHVRQNPRIKKNHKHVFKWAKTGTGLLPVIPSKFEFGALICTLWLIFAPC